MSKSTSANISVKSAALDYISKGWAPIPIPYRSKAPRDGWDTLQVAAANIDQHFGDEQINIGIRLGALSGGLVDVDCDWPEAVELAPYFLPPTSTFGRDGKPKSHYLYQASPAPEKTRQWKFGNEMVVELRSTGGQTVFPPSVHPSGEQVAWTTEHVLPTAFDAAELSQHVATLATAAVMLRFWPRSPGQRDELAMAYAGMLLRCGHDFTVDHVEKLIRLVAKTAGDEEADKRAAKVQRTKDKLDGGGLATGRPTLVKILGEAPANAIADWLSLPGQHLSIIDELNAKHAVVRDQGKTRVYNEEFDPIMERWVFTSSTFTDFKQFYMNKKIQIAGSNNRPSRSISKAEIWLGSDFRRQYVGIVFDPDGEHPGLLNTFRGWGVEPVQGDWSLMQQHIHENTCDGNQEHTNYLLNWLAYGVQYPTRMPEVAVVMRGKRGTGKGVVARAYVHLFGQHGIQVTHSRHLVGNFNAHLRDCIALYADEAFWAGDKQGQSVLQAIITEPTIVIERKTKDVEHSRNLLHLIMTANADWVIPAGLEERRFFVLDVSDRRKTDIPYFKAIGQQMANGGYAAMLFDLLKRDLTDFDPRHYPKTAALLEQKLFSMQPHQKWWYEKLYNGQLTDDHDWSSEITWIISDLLYEDYVRVTGKSGVTRRSVQTELGIQIKKLLPEAYPKQDRITCEVKFVRSDGEIGTNTMKKQHWGFPSLQACRVHFEKLIEAKIKWPKMRGNEI